MTQSSILISTNKSKLDVELIHHFLTNSYWAKGRSIEQVEKSIQHSMCFGVYENDQQIGFARVITDQATYAYIADVFIVEDHRAKGYGKQLMTTILSNEILSEVDNWYLITKDAQGLYQQLGFINFDDPEKTVMRFQSTIKK